MTAEYAGRKVFVGGLDYSLDGDDIRLYFSKFGGIEDSVVLTNDRNGPFPGRSRGFGFVTFNDEASAKKVIDSAPHTLGEKTVEVKMAIPKDQLGGAPRGGMKGEGGGADMGPSKTNKLFVGGIRNDITDEELMDAFREEGAISVDIMKDRSNGKGRGFAFVVFDNEEVVERLAAERMRMIGDKEAEMKKAQSVSKMRDIERQQGRPNRFDGRGGGGGGPMRNNRNFRDNRGGFNGRGGPSGGGYNDGGYNQGWGQGGMGFNGNMNQNYNRFSGGPNNGGYNGGNYGGGPGGYGGAAGNYGGNDGGYNGGYNSNFNYGNGNSYNQSTAYPGNYGAQGYGGQGQSQGQGQGHDPSQAFQQLQAAVQNFVATTNTQPPADMFQGGYGGQGQGQASSGADGYSGYDSSGSAVSQRTKQNAPYYR